MRTTEEVLKDHLELSKKGSIEEDLQKNFSKDLILLTTHGIYKGHEGLRELNKMLIKDFPEAEFNYINFLFEDEIAFLEWTAYSDSSQIDDGADSYIVREGLIIAQTIHYTIRKKK
ncbi:MULTISPECIES: nuclear transport factor 2 family protein [Flavobacteriaceae]|jgi:hypothetical protein|nr:MULTISPECIES: nuclear transport factor 2 family protein [Flavobacteriaceae]APS39832.1 SnoaL-like polyketide cyclase [Salegentibacter sp. T436]PNW21292.1 SnoaL-like polyketide cyclase [Salegentibacter mishustinae]|tara:strand:- start:18658 stop:19005 length:348 start_codon:yes stop_codon:yes gene_type:complete